MFDEKDGLHFGNFGRPRAGVGALCNRGQRQSVLDSAESMERIEGRRKLANKIIDIITNWNGKDKALTNIAEDEKLLAKKRSCFRTRTRTDPRAT